MIAALLATLLVGTRSVTFTATATGLATNTPLEFVFAAHDSDRDYETLFLLDDPIQDLAAVLEKSGVPRGRPVDAARCRLWPCGVPLKLEPALDTLVVSDPLEGSTGYPPFVWTGGARDEKGGLDAANAMPMALFALFDCPQSPIQFDGSFPQGTVYGRHQARVALKKGIRQRFTLSWDGATKVEPLELTATSANTAEILKTLRERSQASELDVLMKFSDDLTVAEAQVVAQAVSFVDSPRVKLNGCEPNGFFYRAFLPLVRWRERKERLTQPFEITVSPSGAKLVFIEEDWSGEGLDPKLTPREIPFDDAKNHPKTDTAFIFAPKGMKLGELKKCRARMPKTVRNWYLYGE